VLSQGSRIADDQGATIILQGAGQNLRSRSAQAAGQDDHRPGIKLWTDRDRSPRSVTLGILGLHHRSAVDEQSREAHGFFERSAAIVAQVEDQTLMFSVSICERAGPRRPWRFFLTVFAALNAGVKGRQSIIPSRSVRPFRRAGPGCVPGLLILQLDLSRTSVIVLRARNPRNQRE
jgi:hypothetical protein